MKIKDIYDMLKSGKHPTIRATDNFCEFIDCDSPIEQGG